MKNNERNDETKNSKNIKNNSTKVAVGKPKNDERNDESTESSTDSSAALPLKKLANRSFRKVARSIDNEKNSLPKM